MFNIKLLVELEQGVTWPLISINGVLTVTDVKSINDFCQQVLYVGSAGGKLSLTYTKLPNETVVDTSGKILKDQTLNIKYVWINNVLIQPHMLKQISYYKPLYHQDYIDYCLANNITINNDAQHELKFWHSGVWTLPLPDNFWASFANQKKSFQSQINPNFVGYSKEYIDQKLARLKELLNQ